MICKNCGDETQNNYCSHCGQATDVGRITFNKLALDFSNSVFQVDRGFLFTIKELFFRPGNAIRDYIEGKRKVYFKPIAFLLLLSTIYYIVSVWTKQSTWINAGIEGFYLGAKDSNSRVDLPKSIEWFTEHYAYTTLLLLPVFSFASFIIFRKININYVEHIVLNSYITGQQAIIYTFFALLNVVFNHESFENIPLFIAISYCMYGYSKFFNSLKKIKVLILVL